MAPEVGAIWVPVEKYENGVAERGFGDVIVVADYAFAGGRFLEAKFEEFLVLDVSHCCS